MRGIRHNGFIVLAAAVALAALWPAGRAESDEAQQVLRSLAAEAGKTAFSGRQTTVLHSPQGLRTSERLVSTDGKGRFRIEYVSPPELKGEVLCYDGKLFRHLIPRLREVRQSKRAQQGIFPRMFELLRALRDQKARLGLAKDVRVAGRLARVLLASPPGARHPRHKIWVDARAHVPLKVEDLGPDGDILSQTWFSKIDFQPEFRRGHFDLVPPPSYEIVDCDDEALARWRGIGEAGERLGFRPLVPLRLPPGLEARGWDVIDLPQLRMKALALRIGGDHAISVVEVNERALRERTGRRFAGILRELGKGGRAWADRGVVVVLRADAPPEVLDHVRRALR